MSENNWQTVLKWKIQIYIKSKKKKHLNNRYQKKNHEICLVTQEL